MSIMQTLFGNANTQQDPAPAAPAQPTANTTVPSDTNTPPPRKDGEQEQTNPLDAYKDLWNNDPSKQAPDSDPLTFDRTKLAEVSAKMNFTDGITPENIQAVVSGGEDAVKALVDILNAASRNSYMNATETSAFLINNAIKDNTQKITSGIPDIIKKTNVSNKLHTENPMFKNPAVAPIMEALQDRFAAKYPNATADEIAMQAKQYLEQFANVILPPQPTNTPDADKGSDFSSWI